MSKAHYFLFLISYFFESFNSTGKLSENRIGGGQKRVQPAANAGFGEYIIESRKREINRGGNGHDDQRGAFGRRKS